MESPGNSTWFAVGDGAATVTAALMVIVLLCVLESCVVWSVFRFGGFSSDL